MADTRSTQERDAARTRAQNHFAKAEQRDVLVREELARERAATDAKTAKLRALRMAKEEEDRIAAEKEPSPAVKPKVAKIRRIKTG
ncbi:MAG: hypothetical protein JSR55_16045 [Proteobacteria bacterium]|nr:hypothetical protein [Pseudomonadota bacterium]